MGKNSYTFKLTPAQIQAAETRLSGGPWKPVEVPYSRIAVEAEGCRAILYASGKLLVQGRGAEAFVQFVVEPDILGAVAIGYDETLHPEEYEPHMGIDESGKGDFFGPLVVAAAYVDADIARDLRAMGVRDSKEITSDSAALALARQVRARLGEDRLAILRLAPETYNRLYEQFGSINRLLAWGHARCIENLLGKVPSCPRALSDQFGPDRQIRSALMEKGRRIRFSQHPRAEADVAVAAASILARAGFLVTMDALSKAAGTTLPKGASAAVAAAGRRYVEARGGAALLGVAKVHFKTTDDILRALGRTRAGEGLPPAREKKPFAPFARKKSPPPPPPGPTLPELLP